MNCQKCVNIFVKVGVYAVKTVELTTVQKLCCNFKLFLKLFCNEFEESNNLIFAVNNLSLQPQFESYTYKAYIKTFSRVSGILWYMKQHCNFYRF